MILDYTAMETTHIPNFLGGEGTIHAQMRVDELGKILRERWTLAPPSAITPTRPAARSSISCPAQARWNMTVARRW